MSETSSLIDRTVAGFRKAYGTDPEVLAFAPGRVNLIGDHTDYNDGFALPCALQFGTVVAAAPLYEARIIAQALDLNAARDDFRIEPPIETAAQGQWQNHVRGIAAGLLAFGLPVRGAMLAFWRAACSKRPDPATNSRCGVCFHSPTDVSTVVFDQEY